MFIRGATGDKSSRGYLAMRRRTDGDWVPITGQPAPSASDAVDACVEHARKSARSLEEECSRELAIIETNLARLGDGPKQTDRVRLLGQLCKVGEDGTVTMPASSGELPPPRVTIEIDDLVLQAMRRATHAPNLSREAARRILLDDGQNQPLELLLAIADTTPDMIGTVAELLVEVGQQLGTATGWEPDEDGDSGETEGDTDGVTP